LSPKSYGLGLRRDFLPELSQRIPELALDFVEVAPENWLHFGGQAHRQLEQVLCSVPLFCHGLSLSIAGPVALDWQHLAEIRRFLREYEAVVYSEHLAYCRDAMGYLHDLLPFPFHQESLCWIRDRVQQIQDYLQRPLVLENTALYGSFAESDRSELDFLLELLEQSGCELLLDLNNLFVNSQNHGYDPHNFLAALPAEKIRYYHVAGHYQDPDGFYIDTHDSSVAPPVLDLLQQSIALIGPRPTLLEWDNDIPALDTLLNELDRIRDPIPA